MQLPIPSVNFHLWAPCNMRCGFCFAPFHDVRRELLPKGHMGEQDCLRIIEALAQAGFTKSTSQVANRRYALAVNACRPSEGSQNDHLRCDQRQPPFGGLAGHGQRQPRLDSTQHRRHEPCGTGTHRAHNSGRTNGRGMTTLGSSDWPRHTVFASRLTLWSATKTGRTI